MPLRDIPFQALYTPADDPLHEFYIPALNASRDYDRTAGYFSSSALAVAAEGLAHLIANGGRMRLLVGAQLSEEDVTAIRQGYDLRNGVEAAMTAQWTEPTTEILHKRLEALAWMIANGRLEIRVVLPLGSDGHPLPESLAEPYFHTKNAIFADAVGDRIAFSGSINESAQAWLRNHENFHVFHSWDTTKAHLEPIVEQFERLWAGNERGWATIEIPEAARQNLLRYCPAEPPIRDPLESVPEPPPPSADLLGEWREQVRIQFLRDAPQLIDVEGLSESTAVIDPWPHQRQVAANVTCRFPERFLLCDEVGLGKTIEAGLILRQLLITGRVQRALILAPRSVLIQWQEELWEKFALRIPRYDGQRYWDIYERPWPAPAVDNPWDAFPVLLAGSQLAKRADRRSQLLECQGWDLVLVDEAHHARRKDFAQPIYRPNRLLGLLHELDTAGKFTGLLLMTATPMQVHPVEVWDLLRLLGLGARWGADERNFLRFYREIQKRYEDVDWDFVLNLVNDHLITGGQLDPKFAAEARERLGPVQWEVLRSLPAQRGNRMGILNNLRPGTRRYVVELARRHTPLQRFVFRNTRALLREYVRTGLLTANVPTRRPEIVRIPMRADEMDLYRRVDEYVSHFYQTYENERRGMGFIMTVYRRRLTSSFYAVRESLERRLEFLTGQRSFDTTLAVEDVEQEELAFDFSEDLDEDEIRQKFKAEISFLRSFIGKLRELSRADSKIEQLKSDLDTFFRRRSTVLVFTQYTDTMDYVRDQLRPVYGQSVACYSGRGGERWNGRAWQLVPKEDVKAAFKTGEVRILLCTESASEGLNLQTCGVLINYDLPWNPMRVEQRIGRIDRIGQEYAEVWIRNYFYQDTIEDQIYARLQDRIHWFELVVGDLQPILAEVERVTRLLAMLPADQRAAELESVLHDLRNRIQNREFEALDLDGLTSGGDQEELANRHPGDGWLAALEQCLLKHPVLGEMFSPDPQLPGVYQLRIGLGHRVTFTKAVFDEHPNQVELLTYGNPLLDELLAMIPRPSPRADMSVTRLVTSGEPAYVRWVARGEDGQPVPVRNLAELERGLALQPDDTAVDWAQPAQKLLDTEAQELRERQAAVIQQRKRAAYLAERARAQRILVRAALVELALGQQRDLFDKDGDYPFTFGEGAILGLRRHGYPWRPLIQLAWDAGLCPQEDDPEWPEFRGRSREGLISTFNAFAGQARESVQRLAAFFREET